MTYTAKIIIHRSTTKELLKDVEAVRYLLDHLRAAKTRKRSRARPATSSRKVH